MNHFNSNGWLLKKNNNKNSNDNKKLEKVKMIDSQNVESWS